MSMLVQFIDYVHSQNPDKEIDNSSWETCAVGEFSRFVEYNHSGYHMANEFIEEANDLRNELGNGKFSTYGQLQTYLKENF